MGIFLAFPDKHDPNSRGRWRFNLVLDDPALSLTSARIDVVDASSNAVDAATDLVIEQQTFGQISGAHWVCDAWISGGGASSKYYLRCRGEDNAQPLSNKFDRTMVLICRQL